MYFKEKKMIPVDITNREEAYEWLLRHGYSVDVANEELKNWEAQTVPAYDEDGEEYEEDVVEFDDEDEYELEEDEDEYELEEEYEDEDEDDDDGLPSDVER
jgi:DNA-directed RNA polymerase delta subunit